MQFVACDFDGTLRINEQVKTADIESIKQFRKNGHKFAICTGRTLDSILKELNKYQIPFDYVLGVNGALAVDSNNKLIYAYEMNLETIHKIQAILKKYHIQSYHISNGFGSQLIFNKYDIETLDIQIDQIRGYYIDAVDSASAVKLTDTLNSSVNQYAKAYTNGQYVAVGIIGIHKGYGVEHLTNLIKFKGDIHVIGDDYNDIPMFKRFNSYGIKTGVQDAIVFAKQQVNSVAEVLEYLSAK